MKGVGETYAAKALVATIMECEYRLQTKSWFGRVPSYSNIPDDPSRLVHETLMKHGSKLIDIPWKGLWSNLPALRREETGSFDHIPKV